jgi:flagellar biosynthesis/type III secretory pathway M-ring protein FliF/YscJ
MLMFEDLDWKGAFRRAAFAALLYLLFVYVMSLAFPDSFGASNNLTSALVVAVAFFFIYAPVFALAERRKRRRLAELDAQKKGRKPGARAKTGTTGGSGEEVEAGDLRGRHNPNTSRKKAARRRRR